MGARLDRSVSRSVLARLLLVGFPGQAPHPRSQQLIQAGIGGLVLFRRNIDTSVQLRRLIRTLRSGAPGPLEVAVDQEPGRIARLDGIVDGLPPARELGRLDEGAIRSAATRLGADLAHLGVTVDFAPVLDVSGTPAETVIGDRSFGEDPIVVARAGVAFMEGLLTAGVQSVGKHFPGHGRTVIDSHRDLPTIQASEDDLLARDVAPFRAAIEAGIPRIMIGHLLVPSLDPDLPMSLSRSAVVMLREELGFQGIICTDDLEMKAITSSWTVAEAAEMAIAAGVDQVVIKAHGFVPAVLDRLEAAVALGRLNASAVRDSVERILEVAANSQRPQTAGEVR